MKGHGFGQNPAGRAGRLSLTIRHGNTFQTIVPVANRNTGKRIVFRRSCAESAGSAVNHSHSRRLSSTIRITAESAGQDLRSGIKNDL